MRTRQAVTGASGIPVGYGALVVVYLALAVAVWWVLRRLAAAPLAATTATPRRGGSRMTLAEVPLVVVLVGLVAYIVLAGADFGAGFWQLTPGARANASGRCATTRGTRSRRSGRRTTSG